VAERQITIAPLIPVIVVENRRFLAHAVTWAANQGIRQFIDVGCDMPTSPTTGEVAREVHADARVAYIDTDPVVVSHLDALLAHGSPGVTVVDGDVRDVPGVLARVSEGVDLSPAGLPDHGHAAALSSMSPTRRTWWPGTSPRWRPVPPERDCAIIVGIARVPD